MRGPLWSAGIEFMDQLQVFARARRSGSMFTRLLEPIHSPEVPPEVDTLPRTPNYVHLVPLTASGGVPTSEAGEKFSHSSFTKFHM